MKNKKKIRSGVKTMASEMLSFAKYAEDTILEGNGLFCVAYPGDPMSALMAQYEVLWSWIAPGDHRNTVSVSYEDKEFWGQVLDELVKKNCPNGMVCWLSGRIGRKQRPTRMDMFL